MATTPRLPQSAAYWCLKQADLETEEICGLALKLDLQIDLPPMKRWAQIQKRGITISSVMVDMEDEKPYAPGYVDPAQWDFMDARLTTTIKYAADAGIKRMLVFSGYKVPGIHRDQAIKNVIKGFKRRVVKFAERAGIILCLEMLNTIGADETMEGHPLYLLDCTADTIAVVDGIASPNFMLAADLYHQAMMGQPSLTLASKHASRTGIVHTAGFQPHYNRNRCPLDAEGQKIDFPSIINELVEAGYTGSVCHEFLYRKSDPLHSLQAAIKLCS
jgi:sugar phosphate isomerase/epimerase